MNCNQASPPNLRISMIVPILNEVAQIEKLCAWKHLVDEYIVVDGGSIDGGLNQLALRGIHCLKAEQGRASQMNAGASQSTGDILWFVHADSDIDAEHVWNIRQSMECASKKVVGGWFDVQLSSHHRALCMVAWMMNRRSRLSGIATGDQCLFVRREVFEEMGGFPYQPLMEDIEFSKRLKRYGNTIQLHHKVVTSSRRWEQYGMIRTILLMWKFRLLYWLGVSPKVLSENYRHVR